MVRNPLSDPIKRLTPRQKKEQQKAENAEGAAGGKKKKVTAAQLRVQKGEFVRSLVAGEVAATTGPDVPTF
jgi:ubiquitin-conjugating enzyme E2 M